MDVDVTPEVTGIDDGAYIIALRGTAPLGTGARGWFKTKIAWWSSQAAPGRDIVMEIPKAAHEPPTGTMFEAAVYWSEREPGKGAPLWWGKYMVRDTPLGPALAAVE